MTSIRKNWYRTNIKYLKCKSCIYQGHLTASMRPLDQGIKVKSGMTTGESQNNQREERVTVRSEWDSHVTHPPLGSG